METIVIAVIASLPGIAALVWNIWRERRKVKVKLDFGWMPYDTNGEEVERFEITFIVINDGRHPVYIERVGIVCSDDFEYSHHYSLFGVDRCIQPGANWTYVMYANFIKKHVEGRNIKFGIVEDATSKIYKKSIPKWAAKQLIS